MSKLFQLIVKGESGKYAAGDSQVIDLNATTIDGAREEAKIRLGGDPSMWKGSWTAGGQFYLCLDGDDAFYHRYGHSTLLGRDARVYSASVVEVHEIVELKPLRDAIRDFTVEEKRRKERERDEADLERLQKKLGVSG